MAHNGAQCLHVVLIVEFKMTPSQSLKNQRTGTGVCVDKARGNQRIHVDLNRETVSQTHAGR